MALLIMKPMKRFNSVVFYELVSEDQISMFLIPSVVAKIVNVDEM